MRQTVILSMILYCSAAAFATHIPGSSEPIQYNGPLAPGSGVTGAIGWERSPVDGYNWYCLDVTSGTAVTITVARTSGDIIPNIGVVRGVFEDGTAVGEGDLIQATENDTQTTSTLTFTPAFSGPATVWVSTWLGEKDGAYTISMVGGGARGNCSPSGGPTAPPPPDVTVLASDVTILNDRSGNVMVTTQILPSFNSALTLAAEGLPLGVTASFAPPTINAPGSGTSVMTLNVGPDVTAGTYILDIRARGANDVSFVTSILLTIPCDPPFILDRPEDQPRTQSVNVGQRAVLRVNATGSGPLRYQWYMGPRGSVAFPIRGVSGPEMTTPPIQTETPFWVRVTNTCGSADSWAATVTPTGGGNGKKPARRSRGGN